MGSIPEDDSATGFSLGSTERDGQPQFRDFAELILGFLHSTGLQEADKLRRAPEGNTAAPEPEADAGPYDPDLRRFTLENGQTAYVYLNGWRSGHGYKDIAVLTRQQAEETFIGSRAERAVVTATTALAFKPVDVQRLTKALAYIDGPFTKSAKEHGRETAERLQSTVTASRDRQKLRENAQRAMEFLHNLQTPSLEYVLALLRHSRRNFDDLPRDEQVGLILVTCEYLNALLESIRKLGAFLEYGTPKGLPRNTVDNLNRDVQAAILDELTELDHRQIGEELGVPPPPSSAIKGGHDTVRKMVERGRSFSIRLFGDEGWQERLTSMKAEAERYWALSEEERIVEDLAESQRISKAEARELRDYRRQRYADWRDELDSVLEMSDLDPPSTAEREDHRT
jgi:hypothetical protein